MSIGKHSDADFCKLKITYCYGLQNLTIHTPQTRRNASVGTVPTKLHATAAIVVEQGGC